jgi:hypothetical protein
MAGDKRDSSPQSRPGARGARRTRESMKKAGVTDAGITLVEALAALIDERWPSRRQGLLDALGESAAKVGLDRKRLSKELGSADKPHGPDWHITELIATGCVEDPADRRLALARLAGLYCLARKTDRPPGYPDAEPIAWPPGSGREGGDEGSAAMREVIDRLQLELDHKISSLEELRSLYNGAYQKLAEQQMSLDRQRRKMDAGQDELAAARAEAGRRDRDMGALTSQVTVLTARVVTQDTELEHANADRHAGAALLAQKEVEIERLTQEVMHQSAQALQARTELEEARRTIAVQQRGLHDSTARLAEHDLVTAVARQRHTNLRERCARLAAQVEYTQRWHPRGATPQDEFGGAFALAPDPAACGYWRALAAYLRIHQEYSGRTVGQVANALVMPHGYLENLLTAYTLPEPQQLAALVTAVGAEITHARLLYDDAVTCPGWEHLPPPAGAPPWPPPDFPPPPSPDYSYESIVGASIAGQVDRDNVGLADGDKPANAPTVTLSPGDSDTLSPGGETGDNSTWTQSPVIGDKAVTADRDGPPSPIRLTGGDTALYRSSSHQRQQRRHRWTLRAVTAVSTVCIPLPFTIAAARIQPLNVPAVYLSTVAACLICWAIAIATRVTLRRSRYRGRHAPGSRTPASATVTGRAAPTPEPRDTLPSPVSDIADWKADVAGTVDVPAAVPPLTTTEVPIEPNLQSRAQQLAHALAGRHQLGVRPNPDQGTEQNQDPDVQNDPAPA